MQRNVQTSQSKTRHTIKQETTRTQTTFSEWEGNSKTLSTSPSTARQNSQGHRYFSSKFNKNKSPLTDSSYQNKRNGNTNNIIDPQDIYMLRTSRRQYIVPNKLIPYQKQLQTIIMEEINRIHDNAQLSQLDPIKVVLDHLENNIILMQKMVSFVQKIHLNIRNRSLVVDLIQMILQVVTTVRNPCLIMLVHYYSALIILNYKNPIHAILLFKQSKRLADDECYLNLKMKCYMHLGKLFMNLRQNLCLLYLTKYLTLAWKLDKQSQELNAYDLLGKYNFYMGDSKTATIFHQKMVLGHYEPQNSLMKKLAIAKFDSQRRMKPKEDYNIKKVSDEPEFVVSSDEEVFDVLLNAPLEQNDEQNDKLNGPRRKPLLKYQIRNLPKFNGHSEAHRKDFENNQANENIRVIKVEIKNKRSEAYQIDHKQQFDIVKDQVYIQHLSPNRTLGMYQHLELTNDSKSYKRVKDLNVLFEPLEHAAVTKTTQKFIKLLTAMIKFQDQLCRDMKANQSYSRGTYQ